MGKEGDKDGLEIERRFLLTNVPNLSKQKNVIDYAIEQHYIEPPVEGQVYRLRAQCEVLRKGSATSSGKAEYFRTTKESVSHGIVKEVENKISKKQYLEELYGAIHDNKILGSIFKNRTVVRHKNLTWEIDKFRNMHLIIAEVELDDLDSLKKLPEFISKVNIMEVTGVKELSNYSLAKKHKL